MFHCHGNMAFLVCFQFCRMSHFLARYNLSYVTGKGLTDAKFIAWIRFVSTFEEFATASLQTVAKSCLHQVITFLNPHVKPTVHQTA